MIGALDKNLCNHHEVFVCAFLNFFYRNSNGFQCPEVGLRFKTTVLDDRMAILETVL